MLAGFLLYQRVVSFSPCHLCNVLSDVLVIQCPESKLSFPKTKYDNFAAFEIKRLIIRIDFRFQVWQLLNVKQNGNFLSDLLDLGYCMWWSCHKCKEDKKWVFDFKEG